MAREKVSGAALSQTFCHLRINCRQEVLTFKIGAGLIIRKILALLRSSRMNQAAPAELAVDEKNTGTVFFYLEGISFFNKSFSHLAVTEMEMASYPVDINGSNEENRTGEAIAAEARAIITEHFIGGFCCILSHKLCIPDLLARISRTRVNGEYLFSTKSKDSPLSPPGALGRRPWPQFCRAGQNGRRSGQKGCQLFCW